MGRKVSWLSLQTFPFKDVKLLAKAIGRSCKGEEDDEKQQQITELLRALLASLDPNAPYKTRDQRPLHSHYASILPACGPEFVRDLICQRSNPLLGRFSVDRLLQNHYVVLRELVLNVVFNSSDGPHSCPEYLHSLSQRMPPISGQRPGWSASMDFSLTLLRQLSTKEDAKFPSELFLVQLVQPLMRRAVRKRHASTDLQEIAELAITYLEKNAAAAAYLSFTPGGFIHHLARCWSWNVELFEDPLTSAIALRPHVSRMDVDQFEDIVSAVRCSKRYALLQLLVADTKGLGANISEESELRALRVEKWPCNMFKETQQVQAVSLLRALIRVRPEGSFLRLERGSTVLAQSVSPDSHHADPALLLTLLERGQIGA